MSHLHPERWHELEPEFVVQALLEEARSTIEQAKVRTEGLGRVEYFVHHGLQALHPVTRDPEAREEFSQRKAGTYTGASSPAAKSESDELRALKAQLAELQKRLDERVPPKPPEPPKEPQG